MREFSLPLFPSKSALPFKHAARSPFKRNDIPHSLLCRSDKKVEGPDEKELKKKEKQRLEKEKKELKEKQEREKKEQKEREKKENEMKKKFQVSGVILTEEGGMKVEERGRVRYISWHTNLSGFIPHSRRVALSNVCRLKRNLCKHCSFVAVILFFYTILLQKKETFSWIHWVLPTQKKTTYRDQRIWPN